MESGSGSVDEDVERNMCFNGQGNLWKLKQMKRGNIKVFKEVFFEILWYFIFKGSSLPETSRYSRSSIIFPVGTTESLCSFSVLKKSNFPFCNIY